MHVIEISKLKMEDSVAIRSGVIFELSLWHHYVLETHDTGPNVVKK